MSKLERAIDLNADLRARLFEYQELYFRYLRAVSDFPECAKAIEEPDHRPFYLSIWQNHGGLDSLKREWRKEFARRA